MDADTEFDLEIAMRDALEDAYRDWHPIAVDRDWEWAMAEAAALDGFAAWEDDALIEDCRLLNRRVHYRAYLQTETWRCRAARVKRWNICGRCGTRTSHLDAHHKTYDRLGFERPSDLIALCRACHEQEHWR